MECELYWYANKSINETYTPRLSTAICSGLIHCRVNNPYETLLCSLSVPGYVNCYLNYCHGMIFSPTFNTLQNTNQNVYLMKEII